jgi:hypothetical protein
MRTESAITRSILLGASFLALASCDNQRSEQINQPATEATDGKEMAPTRSGYADDRLNISLQTVPGSYDEMLGLTKAGLSYEQTKSAAQASLKMAT